MFGFSFGEILVISLVALVAVGPQKLPGMLKTMGMWARKLRKMTMDVRQQTGIDEMLRAEGIQLAELRSLMRGYHHDHSPFTASAPAPAPAPAPTPAPAVSRYEDPYDGLEPDPTREYPLEGADAYGALPDDLLEPGSNEVAAAPGAPPAPEPEIAATEATTETAPVAEPAATEPSAAIAVPTPSTSAAPEAAAELPEIEPEPASEPKPVARSAPPPPPSRSGVPRPSSGPPPAPRRSPAPPRPEPSDPAASQPEASASVPSSPGTVNGNG